jgi:IS30 family transposase
LIRHLHNSEKLSRRTIAARLGVARDTVAAESRDYADHAAAAAAFSAE